jgi:hypothetical protein
VPSVTACAGKHTLLRQVVIWVVLVVLFLAIWQLYGAPSP